jgi:hypothetical protein
MRVNSHPTIDGSDGRQDWCAAGPAEEAGGLPKSIQNSGIVDPQREAPENERPSRLAVPFPIRIWPIRPICGFLRFASDRASSRECMAGTSAT